MPAMAYMAPVHAAAFQNPLVEYKQANLMNDASVAKVPILPCIALSAFVRKRAEIDALARMRTSKRTPTRTTHARTPKRMGAGLRACISICARVFFSVEPCACDKHRDA